MAQQGSANKTWNIEDVVQEQITQSGLKACLLNYCMHKYEQE